jgi:ankyrin repeat protein
MFKIAGKGLITLWIISSLLVPQDSPSKYTALGIAAKEGHTDAVTVLIQAGSDVNHQDSRVIVMLL